MAIRLINRGNNIMYVNGSLVRNILKTHVREVTVVKGPILRIDLGQGSLNDIYIDQTKVIFPFSSSPQDLKEKVLAMVTGEDIPLLTSMEASFFSINNKVFSQSTIQDYSRASTIYYGYVQVGHSDTSQPIWAIQRITTLDGVHVTLWASGTNAFDKIWDNRTEYTYS